jgi:succinate-semialdehyde dehydrogenase/glutarate-semialdehyde dehydrogenase
MNETGMPTSLFQTILVDHDQVVDIIKSRTVSAVSLTGSEKAGRSVAAIAGGALKKCVLELGGSDPYIIFPDADVKKAAELCMRSRLFNNGQSCIAAKRFIIHRDVYNLFREECIAIVSGKKIGDPAAKETQIGPLAKVSILDETKKQVKDSINMGAKIVFESKDLPNKGFYHPIMILENVKKGQPVFDDEVFAPVASFIKFSTTDEAIALANDHRYGLGAAVFTKDLALATEIASNKIESGFVAVNSMVASDPRLPFGGVKDSGYGRELSVEGMLEFVNTKTVVVNT